VTTLDAIALRRANEQTAAVVLDGRWERDSWDVPRDRRPARPPRRACLAGDCARKVQARGYCHMHAERIKRGIPVDWSESDPGRRPAIAARFTGEGAGR
jgi:hypothetical protein